MDKDSGGRVDLKKEVKANQEKIAALETETREAIYDLGRHLANLGLDGGYAEIGDLIQKAQNLMATLRDTVQELEYTRKLQEDYKAFRKDLDGTRIEVKRLSSLAERQIGQLGEQAYDAFQAPDCPAGYRSRFETLFKGEEMPSIPDADDEANGNSGLLGRLKSLRHLLDPRSMERRHASRRMNQYTGLGWKLLKADFEDHAVGDLRRFFETVKQNLMNLLEQERHLRARREGLAAFDREIKKEWGYKNLEAMALDLDHQRARLQERVDALHSRIGGIFNDHRLHNYVDDSFVRACRQRIKRFHVRINQLKFRQKDLVIELKDQDDPATSS